MRCIVTKRTSKLLSFLIAITIIMSIVPISISSEAGTKNEVESNDYYTQATITYDDYTNYGKISSLNDVDWWKISFSSVGTVNIYLGDIPNGYDYDIELYMGDASNMVAFSKKTSGSYEFMQCRITPGVVYYVKVTTQSSTVSTSRYQLRFKKYDLGSARLFTFDAVTDDEDEIATRPVANIMIPFLMGMDYTVSNYPNHNAYTAFVQFPTSSIFLISNHASPGMITLDDTDGDTSYLTAQYVPGLYAYQKSISEYANGELSSVKLAIFMGCKSGCNGYEGGNLVDKTLEKGASVCIGWDEIIYVSDTQIFADLFIKECYDGSNIQKALMDSAVAMYRDRRVVDPYSITSYYVGQSNVDGVIV